MNAQIDVVIIDHPAGALACIRYDEDREIVLTREQAMQLFQKLQAEIGKMPVKL